MDREGRLRRVAERDMSPFIYAGAGILKPDLFRDLPEETFSLNRVFDRSIEAERLFGVRLDGLWITVGTPRPSPRPRPPSPPARRGPSGRSGAAAASARPPPGERFP